MTITVYSTPTCPYCKMAKDFLKEKGIEFKDIDVSQDRAKADEMVEKSGQMGVPVIDIDGEVLVGFDKDKIESLVDKEKKELPPEPSDTIEPDDSEESGDSD